MQNKPRISWIIDKYKLRSKPLKGKENTYEDRSYFNICSRCIQKC